jgi:5-methylcytosine-specific restriction protein A
VNSPVPTPPGHDRSPHWPAVERAHLRAEPRCRACGHPGPNDVHHVVPYHVDPARELDPTNLVTLCRTCHLVFGHLHDWSSWNTNVIRDADRYRARVRSRPAA